MKYNQVNIVSEQSIYSQKRLEYDQETQTNRPSQKRPESTQNEYTRIHLQKLSLIFEISEN